MSLHETIYTLRTARNMSQLELAEALDVSRQSISKWETGTAMPELDKLVKLSDVFGITLDELVRGAAEPGEAKEEKENVSQPTVIIERKGMEPHRIVALALLCTSLVLMVLLAGFGGGRVALVAGLPLVSVSAIFSILPRRHLLWGFWLLWTLALVTGRIVTGGSFLSWAVAGPLGAVIGIGLCVSLFVLRRATVRRLKKR